MFRIQTGVVRFQDLWLALKIYSDLKLSVSWVHWWSNAISICLAQLGWATHLWVEWSHSWDSEIDHRSSADQQGPSDYWASFLWNEERSGMWGRPTGHMRAPTPKGMCAFAVVGPSVAWPSGIKRSGRNSSGRGQNWAEFWKEWIGKLTIDPLDVQHQTSGNDDTNVC